MKTPRHFILTSVQVAPGQVLRLSYADGAEFDLDVVRAIGKSRLLRPILRPQTFPAVALVHGGSAVRWAGNEDLELAADNLRAMAIEQSGRYSHQFLWNWMHGHGMTLDDAAEALGLSRRMIAYYRSGSKPLPTTVALACHGYDALAVKAA